MSNKEADKEVVSMAEATTTAPTTVAVAKPATELPSLEEGTNIFSYVFLGHLSRLFTVGYNRELQPADLGGVSTQDRADLLYAAFIKHFDVERAKPREKRSLWGVLWRTVGYHKLFLALVLFGFSAALQFGPVIILTHLVKYFAGVEEISDSTLWIIISMLFVFPMVGSIALAHSNAIMAHIGAQVRNILIGIIYRKALTISPAKKQSISTGRILTMFSDDTNQIRQFLFFLNNSVIAPLQIGATLYLIYQQVKASTFVGLGYQVFTVPITGVVFGVVAKMRQGKMRYTDKRVKLLNEVLNGIRIIKYYAWENAFVKKVMEHRAGEVDLLMKMGYLFNTVFGFLLLGAPQIQTVLIFWTFTALGNQLNAAIAFTTMALFGLLTTPFIFLPYGLQQYNQSLVSTQRIMDFLCQDDLEVYIGHEVSDPEVAIHFQNANLGWIGEEEAAEIAAAAAKAEADKKKPDDATTTTPANGTGNGNGQQYQKVADNEKEVEMVEKDKSAATADGEAVAVPEAGVNRSVHTLENLNIRIKKGQLVGIVGPVGSGKSSFLSSILGEMNLKGGSLSVSPEIKSSAFCDQRAWIVNASVKENVLFGKEFDEAKFNKAIYAAAMEDDLKILIHGLDTEIGERGINLSGGQKARVSLARAVYNDADLYLLDDPLSAVDAHVGEHIFQKCIVEALAGKTRLLVTHHSQFLPRCDYVIILDTHGRVIVNGSYREITHSGIDISQFLGHRDEPRKRGRSNSGGSPRDRANSDGSPRDRSNSDDASEGTADVPVDEEDDEEAPKEEEKPKEVKALMTVEEKSTGSVPFRVYWAYIVSGGMWVFFFVAIFQLFCQVLSIESSFWLADWGKEVLVENVVNGRHITYARNRHWLNGYAGLNVASVVCMGFSRIILTRHRTVASVSLHNKLLQKVLYFPVSFFDVTPIGRVINRFSQDIATIDEDLAQAISQVVGMGGGVAGALGGIIGSTKGTFLILFFPLLFLYYRFQQFFARSNTAIARIEAVSRSPIYADFSQTLSGTNTIRAYGQQKRFIEHLETLANANTVPGVLQQIAGQWLAIRLDFVGSIIMLFMGCLTAGLQHKNFIPAGYLGLGLSYSIQLTSLMKMTVRVISTAEAQFNSVDRVLFYTQNVPVEEPELFDSKGELVPKAPSEIPKEWPSEGTVEFQNVEMGYRDGDLVLKGVSFKVNAQDKIGIAGRTGCGKSSLMVTLFRIEGLRAGRILIDGVDIAKMPLQHLRSKLCIIPQDPVMFSATVRFNVDPFDEFSDAEVWEVLRDVNMHEHVSSLPNKLQEMVAEGGDNFSAGQRQLVCIARAILRKPKILVMDEATASIDQSTDNFIQEMIRVKFRECTVLTIAHRLETIIDSTKVLVMDAGHVAEYDAPAVLLAKEAGEFKGLWDRHKKGLKGKKL
jgi:ATP-binding cassette subfamily C (CFTR/MRP) protein 1